MQGRAPIPQGPDDFERLLEHAALSGREAQAARSAVLGMTAGQAAPVIGVSASTVGSYRQRAYAKLGVATRAEFMRLEEVASWAALLREDAEGPETPDEAQPTVPEEPERGAGAVRVEARWALLTVVLSVVVVASVVAIWAALLPPAPDYLRSPQGVVETEYGEVPNVTGMCADAAATAVASAGFCPEFEPRASELAAGTVLEVGPAGEVDRRRGGTSSFSWGAGCTAGYDRRHGGWDASVVLVVAV